MSDTDKMRVMDVAVDGDDLDDLRKRKRTGQGRIEYDEQGNPVRSQARGLAAHEVMSRLLDDDRFAIDEGPPAPGARGKISRNPAGLKKGYDPYESGLLDRKEHRKKRDLRALSAWIEARKRAESGKE
jgi:hypothetical protein